MEEKESREETVNKLTDLLGPHNMRIPLRLFKLLAIIYMVKYELTRENASLERRKIN
jgi:hypothetical protein